MSPKLFPLLCATLLPLITCQDVYQIGTGIADITGPAADIGMVSINDSFPTLSLSLSWTIL